MTLFGLTVSTIIFWLIIALIMLIVEALTAGLTTIWFAGGAFAALVCALLDLPVAVQIVIFFIVSICLLVFTRKIFVEKLKTGSQKTNVDALIGKQAIVIEKIDNLEGRGRIQVDSADWTARSDDGSVIDAGCLVEIHRIEGVRAYVAPVHAAVGAR